MRKLAGLLLISLASLSFSTQSKAAQPIRDPSDLVDRQLIVLVSATTDGFKAKFVAAAASDASVDGALHARLGAPSSGRRLLEGMTSQRMQDDLAKTPSAPRARLEHYVLLTYPTAQSAAAAKNRLQNDMLMLSVEKNILIPFASATPTDRYFSATAPNALAGTYQWGMQAMQMPSAWEKIRGTAWLAALDAGIDKTHPDLQQNLRLQFSRNFAQIGNSPIIDAMNVQESPKMGHGTHVAGIMAATPQYGSFDNNDNNTGVAGACWTCSFFTLRVAEIAPDIAVLATALNFAVDHGVQVANISLSHDATPSCASGFTVFCDALATAVARDVTVVVAAGNTRINQVGFPAREPGVIAVGGLQNGASGTEYWANGYGNGNICTSAISTNGPPGSECGSNYGPELAVMAPAMDIVSTFVPGSTYFLRDFCGDDKGPDVATSVGYASCTGTSMAAPHISGLVGLMRSANPLLPISKIKAILTDKANNQPCVGPYQDRCFGAGLPDAGKVIAATLGGPQVLNRLSRHSS